MIISFRHRGLKRLYEEDDSSKVRSDHADKLRRILADLDVAQTARDLDKPGYVLHPLKGNLKGFWAVRVSGNWRVIFRIDGGDVSNVDYDDYH